MVGFCGCGVWGGERRRRGESAAARGRGGGLPLASLPPSPSLCRFGGFKGPGLSSPLPTPAPDPSRPIARGSSGVQRARGREGGAIGRVRERREERRERAEGACCCSSSSPTLSRAFARSFAVSCRQSRLTCAIRSMILVLVRHLVVILASLWRRSGDPARRRARVSRGREGDEAVGQRRGGWGRASREERGPERETGSSFGVSESARMAVKSCRWWIVGGKGRALGRGFCLAPTASGRPAGGGGRAAGAAAASAPPLYPLAPPSCPFALFLADRA